jgi:hypothetical protein
MRQRAWCRKPKIKSAFSVSELVDHRSVFAEKLPSRSKFWPHCASCSCSVPCPVGGQRTGGRQRGHKLIRLDTVSVWNAVARVYVLTRRRLRRGYGIPKRLPPCGPSAGTDTGIPSSEVGYRLQVLFERPRRGQRADCPNGEMLRDCRGQCSNLMGERCSPKSTATWVWMTAP